MKNKLDFTILVIFVFVSGALAFLAFSFGGVDFSVYYAASKVTLSGGNPYDYQQLAPQIISNSGKLNNPYYYAPWFTWFVIPFSLFPYQIARGLWALFNFILWMFSLRQLSSILHYPTGAARWSIWLFATIVFAWSTWGAEQVGIIILFLFIVAMHYISQKNWTATGIILTLLLFKPNITLVPSILVVVWLLIREKTWKPIVAIAVTGIALTIVSLVITPYWYKALLDPDKIQGLSYTLNSTGEMEIKRLTTTLSDFLNSYGINGFAATVIQIVVGIGSLIAICWALLYTKSIPAFLSIAIMANFVNLPYTLFYDYPSLVIPLFLSNSLLFEIKQYHWLRYAMIVLTSIALFIGNGIPYRYWILVILVVFTISVFYLAGAYKLEHAKK